MSFVAFVVCCVCFYFIFLLLSVVVVLPKGLFVYPFFGLWCLGIRNCHGPAFFVINKKSIYLIFVNFLFVLKKKINPIWRLISGGNREIVFLKK